MNCGQCGNTIKEQGKFCGKCGWPVPAMQPLAQPLDQDAETVAALPRPVAMPPARPLEPPPGLPPAPMMAAPWPPAGSPPPSPPAAPPPGPPPGFAAYSPSPVPKGLFYGGVALGLLVFAGGGALLLNRNTGGSASEAPSARNFLLVDFSKPIGRGGGMFDFGGQGFPAAVVGANLQTKLAASEGWLFPAEHLLGMVEGKGFLRCASLNDGKGGVIVLDAEGELHRNPLLKPIDCTGQYPAPARQTTAGAIGPCTYIKRDWARLTPEEFGKCGDFEDGLARVAIGQRYGYINAAGKIAIPARFQRALSFHGGRALASESGDRFGLIDTTGKFVVPERFSEVYGFSDGLAFVRQNQKGKVGAISADGSFKIEPRYEKVIEGFADGVAWVLSAGRDYPILIDSTGKEVPTKRYDQISEFDSGVSIVGGRGSYGLVSPNGQEVLPPQFDDIQPFHFGLAAVRTRNRQQSGFIDRTGKLVIPIEAGAVHEFIGEFGYRLTVSAPERLVLALINRSGREVARLSDGKVIVGGAKP